MSGVTNQRVTVGQENGPDVELMVSGTALYSTYRTPDGFPAIYDDDLGLFVYARLDDGRFTSTGVPVSLPPPLDLDPDAVESESVRAETIAAREAHWDSFSRTELDEEGDG